MLGRRRRRCLCIGRDHRRPRPPAPATACAPTAPRTPGEGDWFDPDKLLVDPYAVAIDRPYAYDPRLAAPRGEGGDTAPLVPKAIVTALPPPLPPKPPLFRPAG